MGLGGRASDLVRVDCGCGGVVCGLLVFAQGRRGELWAEEGWWGWGGGGEVGVGGEGGMVTMVFVYAAFGEDVGAERRLLDR